MTPSPHRRPTPATAASTTKGRRPTALTRTAVLIVVAALGVAVALPWLLGAYPISIASYALAFALLAVSTHLLGVAGLPSLGQAAYFGIGAYTAAICARAVTTVGPVQLLAATAVAAAAAAVVAPILVRTRAIAFLLASWAVAELVHTAAEHATAITGGGNGLTTPPITALPATPALTGDGHLYLYVLACTTVLAGIVAVARRSHGMLIVRGIADNEPRIRASGHPVTWHLARLYVAAAALAGAAGSLLVATRHYVAPGDLAFDVTALALLAAIIGRHSTLGAAAAAVTIVVTRDIASDRIGAASPILLGILFLAAALTRTTRPRRLRHASLDRPP